MMRRVTHERVSCSAVTTMTGMTLIADVVAVITGNPAPLLFLDSCILLDVVRAPLRNKPSEIQFARVFLTAALKYAVSLTHAENILTAAGRVP
jgi:hypothetical protein